MKRALLLGLVLAACGGEQQIVLVLDGEVTASSYEVILASSQVSLKRNQRSHEAAPEDFETAFYVVQRNRIDVDLDQPTLLSGIELQLVGAEGTLPIVKAFDGQGVLIAMGILDPQRVFHDDDGTNDENFANRLEAIEDITRFPIILEPVTLPPLISDASKPIPVREGEVHTVRCQQGVSGLVWRPRSSPDYATGQLRIVLPFGDTSDAARRVEADGLDLDCDHHTPILRGLPAGDEQDCDDTSSIVFGGDPPAPEVCIDKLDTDCDSSTIGVDVTPEVCGTCLGNKLTCYETAQIDGQGCAIGCLVCPLVTSVTNGMATACNNLGEIVLPPACGDECVARLIAIDPGWRVKIGDRDEPQAGLLQGHTVVGGKIGVLIEQDPAVPINIGAVTGIALAVQFTPNSPVIVIEVKFGSATSGPIETCRPVEQMGQCNPDG